MVYVLFVSRFLGFVRDRIGIKKFLTGLVLAITILSIANGIAQTIPAKYADTANFLSFTGKDAVFPPLQSHYAATMYELDYLIAQDKSVVCEKVFNPPSYSNNFFRIHAYLLAPVIATTAYITRLPGNWVAALWIAISVVLGLTGIYVFLRKLCIPRSGSSLVITTILLYPVFANSLTNQIYMDQLIFGPAVCLVLLVWWMKYRSSSVWKWAVLLTLIIGSISERGAYTATLISLVYVILLFGIQIFRKKEIAYVALSGLICMIWGYIWNTYIQQNFRISALSIEGSLNRLHSLLYVPHYNNLFIIFLAISATWFLASLLSGRGIIVVLLAVMANLTVDVGGAELTGVATHYHQAYLPILVAFGTIGLGRLSTMRIRQQHSSGFFAILVPMVFLATSLFSWSHFGLRTSLTERLTTTRTLITPTISLEEFSWKTDTARKNMELARFVHSLHPQKVSAFEGLTSALYLNDVTEIFYWPVGISKADVAIVPWDAKGASPFPYGFWGDTESTLRDCLNSELSTHYKLVKTFFEGSLRVYQKIN